MFPWPLSYPPMGGGHTNPVEDAEKWFKFMKSLEPPKKDEKKSTWDIKDWYLLLWLTFPITAFIYGATMLYAIQMFTNAIKALPH